jgi:hypothetical protein
VKKTEAEEFEEFYVNGHPIGRRVKKDGQPLDDHEQQKETERVTKLVEKAQNTPSDQPLGEHTITVSQVLEMMDVRNPRRVTFRGRATIVFDFIGRKDAKTHGLAQDVSKTLQGTMWVDEADRQIAHLEVRFIDNFDVGAGLFARIEKGSSFYSPSGAKVPSRPASCCSRRFASTALSATTITSASAWKPSSRKTPRLCRRRSRERPCVERSASVAG